MVFGYVNSVQLLKQSGIKLLKQSGKDVKQFYLTPNLRVFLGSGKNRPVKGGIMNQGKM